MSRSRRETIPADTSRPTRVYGEWLVVWAPLRDGWKALARPSSGMRILVVDDQVTDEALEVILRECDAAARGDWDEAPHCRRPAPPRPELYVVR